jgi:protease II
MMARGAPGNVRLLGLLAAIPCAAALALAFPIAAAAQLLAAAVIQVGALDIVRSETTATGSQNIPEFGTVENEAGFRALLEMSTYHHVVDGKKYLATLFIHGVNDTRVEQITIEGQQVPSPSGEAQR